MEPLVSGVLTVIAAGVAIPVAVLCVEILAAIALWKQSKVTSLRRDTACRVAVLLPAHNESTAVLPTIADIRAQLTAGGRLLMVADNCTDDTAAIGASAGAEVIARHDPTKVGKSYALDFGIRHLALNPPDVVIFVDADCRLSADAIDQLRTVCLATGRPAQALYLMTTPSDSKINHQVAEFAWRVKNWLRPLGLQALGLPCQLMGTGMAIPWSALRSVALANASIVEDLKLGLDLAVAGYPAVFCPLARVTSVFAASPEGSKTQRTRWEHGHIRTILNTVPGLLRRAIVERNWALFGLTLDLAVPPLSLLVMLMMAIFLVASLAAFFGFSSAALYISSATLLGFVFAIFFAWCKCGRSILPGRAILSIAPYMLGKFRLYDRIISGKAEARWIKTDRTISGQDLDQS